MLEKTEKVLTKAEHTFERYLPVVLMSAMLAVNSTAFAAGNAADLMQLVIGWIGKIIVIPGVFQAVLGIIHYATASSDDGPARSKAGREMAAGGMLILLGAVISAGAGQLAQFIPTS